MAETSGIGYHRYRRMGLQHLQDAYTIASTIEIETAAALLLIDKHQQFYA